MDLTKITSVAVTAAMGLSLMAGCSGDLAPTQDTDETEVTTVTSQTSDSSEAGSSPEETFGSVMNVDADLAADLDIQDLSSDKEREFRKGYLDFAFGLMNSCVEDEQQGVNVMVSPASVMFALDLTGAGAKGQTLAEMCGLFGGAKDPSGQISYAAHLMKSMNESEFVKLHAANSVWVNKTIMPEGIRPEYVSFVHDSFDAESESLIFDKTAQDKINGWVKEKTNGMIPQVIDELDPVMAMLLINAISFEGKWETQYSEGSVQEEQFTAYDGTSQTVQMLNGSAPLYLENDAATGFAKYYEGGRYAFVVMLPKDKTSNAREMLSAFDGKAFEEYLANSDEDRVVLTKMPEFSYDWNKSLVKQLKVLGMNTPFGSDADFSKIADLAAGEYLSIGDVIHKTHIEVDRNGTKAAAVTAVSLYKNAVAVDPRVPVQVYCDRPFAYAIVDMEDAVPLFIGTVDQVSK
ncbi:MAG: serpin family protein [Clostridiales bacterium]|nr:serpin family protein [Clostridiales bacterium]